EKDPDLKTIAREPTPAEMGWDRVFRGLTYSFAWLTILTVVFLVYQIGHAAAPAVERYGLDFLTTATWDAGKDKFGIRPAIWGTLYTSLLGLVIGWLFGLAVALFLTQDFIPPRLETIFKNIVELLAAIPSVVYGLWGIFVVIPAIRPACQWLHEHLGWIPLF